MYKENIYVYGTDLVTQRTVDRILWETFDQGKLGSKDNSKVWGTANHLIQLYKAGYAIPKKLLPVLKKSRYRKDGAFFVIPLRPNWEEDIYDYV